MNRLMFFVMFVWLSVMAVSTYAQGAGRLYAVLINGGRNRLTNHERYWNDCALLYRTLRRTYCVPKCNITVLMSDGGDSERDMLRADGRGFVSSPTDLDGDGEADVDGAALLSNVDGTFATLSQQLTREDRLFVFVIDHGGFDDAPYVWLWGDEQLNGHTLATLLGRVDVGSACILLGQCYSGAFMDYLLEPGRIVITACSGLQQSWACADRPYDEFLYHWTCAVAGADADGNRVDADADGDGHVSMEEAFSYARSHDRRPETPQYGSWPVELGRQWTLGGMIDTGVHDASVEGMAPAVYSATGVCQPSVRRGQLSIVRRAGQTRKIVR